MIFSALICQPQFLNSPSCGASGRLCFVIVQLILGIFTKFTYIFSLECLIMSMQCTCVLVGICSDIEIPNGWPLTILHVSGL